MVVAIAQPGTVRAAVQLYCRATMKIPGRRAAATVALLIFAASFSPRAQGLGPTNAWPEATPQAVGLDATVLASLDADIKAGKYGYVDGLLVIRRGRIAFERAYRHDYDRIYAKEARTPVTSNAHDPSGPYNYFNPWWHPYYRRGDLHTLQSVTKAITSMVFGVAAGRGELPSLDTPVLTYFDTATVANVDDRKRRMTIRHLHTMTAGLDWDEVGPADHVSQLEASFDWVRFAIDRPMSHEPGTVANYNSGATQILAHVFRSATGHDIEEYAARHLFPPLGITNWFWKRSPTGLADTLGGLYLTPRDAAKLAYLYVKDGVWRGRMIVPRDWVRLSLAPSVTLSEQPRRMGGFNVSLYPYGNEAARYAFGKSGFGGQQLIGVPGLDLVIVFNGWNPGRRTISPRELLDRVLEAVVDAPKGRAR